MASHNNVEILNSEKSGGRGFEPFQGVSVELAITLSGHFVCTNVLLLCVQSPLRSQSVSCEASRHLFM